MTEDNIFFFNQSSAKKLITSIANEVGRQHYMRHQDFVKKEKTMN